MKKLVVSNRVFWAGVVLASAALIGRNPGQAQKKTVPPTVAAEVRTHQLVIVDDTNDVAGIVTSTKGGAALSLLSKNKAGSVSIMAVPSGDNAITFYKRGKLIRSISPYPAMDTTEADTDKANK